MFTPIWIVSVALILFSFLGIVLSALLFTKPVDEQKVSFMRIFPFEAARSEGKNAKYYNFSLYLFSGLCFSPIILLIKEQSRLSKLQPLSILIACILGLAALCFVFVNVFDVTHVKPHLSLFIIFASLTILSSTLIFTRGLTAYTIFMNHGKVEYLFLVTEILAGLSTLFSLMIVLNPKLSSWAKLDYEDGNYVRPKKFPLAYSEWGLLLALFINEIIYFIQLLVK